MVHIAADLPQFLQRRELAAYEQRLARTGYAYGVDLRRAAWLAGSMLGDPLMRSVDRRWSRTVQALEDEAVLPQRKAPPLPLLEELATLITMLRAPLPTVRMLRPEVAGQWPAITPLSTTKGAIHWLVIDRDRLMAMPDDERSFVLASALGHLQCEHGPIFAAHLMGHLGGGLRSVRTLMRAWARVAVFSADRAGLLAVRSLDAALRAVEHDDADSVPWMPRRPSLDLRRQALEDFDRSQLMVRRRVLSDPDGGGWTLSPPGAEEDRGSLARRVRGALDRMGRVGDKLEGFEAGPREREARDEAEAVAKARAEAAEAVAAAREAEAEAEREAESSSRGPGPKASAEPSSPEPPPIDEEQAKRLRQALSDAWSLARCDARLTRRLRLL
ncbi:MAG: hypothetical protein KC501_07170 [Myxococcales bacterium]|nr:hypothetical protein [Myxococcales bacterium]